MNIKPNILIVEDDSYIQEMYKYYLDELDLNIDLALTKDDAYKKIFYRSYHVAIIDIMLKDDVLDRSGIDIIKLMKKTNEETSIIVISGTDDIKVALDTFNLGISNFILKHDIKSKEIIIPPIKAAIDKVSFKNIYRDSLFSYFSYPYSISEWESILIRCFSTGYENIKRIIEDTFSYLLPIIRLKNSQHSFNIEDNLISGIFWSKRIGKAIKVFFYKSGSTIHLDHLDDCNLTCVFKM